MDTTYIILISSTAMILLSFFGCFAAMKEIKCFLLTYNVLMLLLLVVLMVGGTLAYIFREQVEWTMKAEMMADLRNYVPKDSSNSVTRSWDEVQSQLECCGFLTEQVDAPWQMWRYTVIVTVITIITITITINTITIITITIITITINTITIITITT